ncbi:DMT family transporter [Rubrivirga sp.]|uniref:DMT family transporter n=1 Tax=Rubrivirga sp. TaxID=1885344 RepID=UPI003C708634
MRAPTAVWFLIGLGLLAFGAAPILIRYAGDAPALTLAFWRTVTVTLVLAPFAMVRARDEIRAFSVREWSLVIGAGILLGLHFMSWIGSVQLTSVASSSALVTLSPVFIVVLGGTFLDERPSARTTVAIGVAVVGAAVLALGSHSEAASFPNPALGNGLAIVAAALVAVYLVIGRAVRQGTSFLAYFVPLNAAAAVTCGIGCVLAGEPLMLTGAAAWLAIAMGLGPGLLGHGSLNVAVRYIPAALIGLLTLTEPVLASGIAAVLFQEIPGAATILGIVIVLSAVVVVVRAREA